MCAVVVYGLVSPAAIETPSAKLVQLEPSVDQSTSIYWVLPVALASKDIVAVFVPLEQVFSDVVAVIVRSQSTV